MKEYNIESYMNKACIHFEVETVDGQEDGYVEVFAGYELMEKLKNYFTEDYDSLFEDDPLDSGLPAMYVRLKHIEYKSNQKGIDMKMIIDGDDAAHVNFNLSTQNLEDENARKVAMIREVLDFDNEAEYSLLRELFN